MMESYNLPRGVYLAQVLPNGVHPDRYEVSVVFAHLAHLASPSMSMTAKCIGRRQHPTAGNFALPEPGDWGIVAMLTDDARSAFWLGSIPDVGRNLIPSEILKADARAEVDEAAGGQRRIQWSDGTTEMQWADGSRLVIGDQTGKPTLRKATRTAQRGGARERKTYTPINMPAATVRFTHKTGTKLEIDSAGKVSVVAGSATIEVTKDGEVKITSATKITHDAPEVDLGGTAGLQKVLVENTPITFVFASVPLPGAPVSATATLGGSSTTKAKP